MFPTSSSRLDDSIITACVARVALPRVFCGLAQTTMQAVLDEAQRLDVTLECEGQIQRLLSMPPRPRLQLRLKKALSLGDVDAVRLITHTPVLNVSGLCSACCLCHMECHVRTHSEIVTVDPLLLSPSIACPVVLCHRWHTQPWRSSGCSLWSRRGSSPCARTRPSGQHQS